METYSTPSKKCVLENAIEKDDLVKKWHFKNLNLKMNLYKLILKDQWKLIQHLVIRCVSENAIERDAFVKKYITKPQF